MLIHCTYIFCYIQIAVIAQYSMKCIVDWWIQWVILLLINIFIQGIVYKIYKKSPLENEKYKNIYMWVNGLFIILEVCLLVTIV